MVVTLFEREKTAATLKIEAAGCAEAETTTYRRLEVTTQKTEVFFNLTILKLRLTS
jgi:hypothetical protein